jgi:hypothetical protein
LSFLLCLYHIGTIFWGYGGAVVVKTGCTSRFYGGKYHCRVVLFDEPREWVAKRIFGRSGSVQDELDRQTDKTQKTEESEIK